MNRRDDANHHLHKQELTDPPSLDLSVLIPVFNEVQSVQPLHDELVAVLDPTGLDYELVYVDDGSSDGTRERLFAIQQADPARVRVAMLRRNSGQTAALSAALDLSRGRVLIPIDGDGQNDPTDIPRLLERLDDGYDVVSGWRKDRKDPWLTRRLPSQIANRLIAAISGVPLHDFGCTLKAYRREVLSGVRLYGQMHRFIPIFASWQGGRVTELVVNHRPRTAGRSKYGLGRTLNVVLDLILIRFYQRYSQRPIHLFGRLGIGAILLSFVCFALMLYFKYGYSPPKSFVETPLPLLTVMFFLGGVQSILLGVLAEMVMRTYYESQDKSTYVLGEVRQAPMRAESYSAPVSAVKGEP
jgi:glycosyltransferase involved in cell wall biosynthesis